MLVLIINRKSHMGFRLLPKSVTLNGVMTVMLRFSPNSVAIGADYVKVAKDKPIQSTKKL